MKFLTRISFLEELRYLVKMDKNYSWKLTENVPQEINLCPTLINVFIDDDLEARKNQKSLYAED